MPISKLDGRRVAILGYGAEGRAALDLLLGKLEQPDITIIEENESAAEAVVPLTQTNPAISLLTGKTALASLQSFDVIIKSPGISPYREEIRKAADAGVTITSGTQLWCDEHRGEHLIIVTGTKGKSTTTSLIAHLLRGCGKKAELIGNIGLPALECFDEQDVDFWVMELSSYQATGLQCSASVGLLLNLFPEHTDWHQTTENYFRDKTEFLHQEGIVTVLLPPEGDNIPSTLRQLSNTVDYISRDDIHLRHDGIYLREDKILDKNASPLPGRHNLENICAALTVLEQLGISATTAVEHLSSFRGLPHRLASLGRQNGIEYIDDSISTTPQSALAALQSIGQQPCTQLLGGFDRNLDWHDFARASRSSSLECVVTLPDNAARIAAAFRAENPTLKVIAANDMDDAVTKAKEMTPEGGVILLSPGAPSYGHYRDFRERGARFAQAAGFSHDRQDSLDPSAG